MSIRARVEDVAILYAIGRPEAALLCALTAVAATSRRRYPRGTPSRRSPPKKMGDGEAFETFVRDEMPRICRIKNFNIKYHEEIQPIELVLYKWLRCQLAHEAALPPDIHFEPDATPGVTKTSIAADGTLSLSHGWLDGLVDTVVHAPENRDEFGDPPTLPYPIHLPKIGRTVSQAPGDQAQGLVGGERST